MKKHFNTKKLFCALFFTIFSFYPFLQGQETVMRTETKPLTVMFTPPQGWRLAEKSALPKHILTMVVGKGASEYPPSMNLGYDIFPGSLKEYLKLIRDINASQGCTLKDLGTIPTGAGLASLCQFDEKTSWGEIRQMHAVILKGGVAYILTASALKDEFPQILSGIFPIHAIIAI